MKQLSNDYSQNSKQFLKTLHQLCINSDNCLHQLRYSLVR